MASRKTFRTYLFVLLPGKMVIDLGKIAKLSLCNITPGEVQSSLSYFTKFSYFLLKLLETLSKTLTRSAY